MSTHFALDKQVNTVYNPIRHGSGQRNDAKGQAAHRGPPLPQTLEERHRMADTKDLSDPYASDRELEIIDALRKLGYQYRSPLNEDAEIVDRTSWKNFLQ